MKGAACILLAGVVCSHTTFAWMPGGPWYALYEQALSAQDDKDWKTSVKLLLEAIKERPQPALKAKTYGLRFVNYVPYYYLGVAHYHLGDKATALKQFAISEARGEIREAPDEYASLKRIRAELTGEKYVALADSLPKASRTSDLNSDNSPWYVFYETALAYIDAGDWLNSAENLKQALAVKGIPRAYARTYGLWYISYLPYYYLGLSYYNQGLFTLAIEYLETSKRFGEIQNFQAEYKNLQDMLTQARTRGPQAGSRLSSEEVKNLMNAELTRAVKLFNDENLAGAETGFLHVLQLDPYNSVAKQYLSRIHSHDSQGDTVHNAAYHAYLGAAYANQYLGSRKKNKTALHSATDEFRRVLELDPAFTLDPRVFPPEILEIFQSARKK